MSALTIHDLTVTLKTRSGHTDIVRGLDLTLEPGRVHGLAGESGSGKTLTALAVLGLLPETMTATGSIRLDDDVELLGAPRRLLSTVRGRRIAMVFQDPSTSLHPQLTVGTQLTDHVRHHLRLGTREARARAADLLRRVQVPDPEGALKKYPHQFSGGQRQRVAIAVALACDPEVLLADEPTTALDVTVQAEVLQLLRRLVDESGLAVLLVTHDLGVMSAVADVVTVMRQGRVVESAPRAQLFTAPQDAYTQGLLAALPGSTVEQSTDALIEGLLTGTAVQADAGPEPAGEDAATPTHTEDQP